MYRILHTPSIRAIRGTCYLRSPPVSARTRSSPPSGPAAWVRSTERTAIRALDSCIAPRSTWLTHVRSGFEQRGRAPVPSPQSRLLRGRSTPHRPHGSSRSSRAAAATTVGLAQRLDQLAGGEDEEALGHRRAAYQNEEVRIAMRNRQEMNRSRQRVGRRDPWAGRPRSGRCAAGAGLGACSDRDRPSRVAR